MILNGIEKSALLLMSIGADQAGEVLKNLTPFEVQELVTSMVNIKRISTEKLNEILCEFYDIVIKNNTLLSNFDDKYLSDMLSRALGEKKANYLLQETLEIHNAKTSIESLNYMKSDQLAFLLNNEHPQIITTILIYLDKNQSAQVLSSFDDKKRAEIISRITEFHGIEDSSLVELSKVINNLIKNKKLILSEKGGIKTAVSILNAMKIKDEKSTLKKINLFNKDLADTILKEMFLFKNIIDLDDKYIKIIIQNIEKEKLYVALQNTDSIIKEKFFKNMSDVESSKLSLSLEKKSYISDASIKNEQKLLLIMIKSIVDNGSISLKNLREYYV
ncbi:MAG: flagellar motor switch protein FliG [Buchnera aphidicola (Brevicoryne brassicae)]|uniref:Flagellar motor switch protein FliG n=1 Tax=Buchnera aphidicola (Brevicoryne brassicae) TaxID=911343 RepID=A0AAJ5TXE0_9GAMM|nr:flagellar motor switch protein FliG [Buchnera aphidicola]QCI19655.1 flagellar motor switch protein FliG [Buchnera aphidicola (Brevicoryne brassicae)]WAI19026.1 MAG: flagellar motor switch protein FliG [Buchnera aphidicola (Brevicoryne brassicae)]